MLVIRMQRTGRKGHAQFRIVVQDSRRTPTSGKIVAQIGVYNPHSKEITLNKENAVFYVEHGAQPTQRVARLLKAQGVKLPSWVALPESKQRKTKNADKLRKNQPAAPIEEVKKEEAPVTEDAPKESDEAVAPDTEEVAPAAAEVPDEASEEPVETSEKASEAPAAK